MPLTKRGPAQLGKVNAALQAVNELKIPCAKLGAALGEERQPREPSAVCPS